MEFENELEYCNKKQAVLNKFRKEFIEGFYQQDAFLHSVVELLVRGMDPYEIIEQLIRQQHAKRKELLEEFEKSLPRVIMTKEAVAAYLAVNGDEKQKFLIGHDFPPTAHP